MTKVYTMRAMSTCGHVNCEHFNDKNVSFLEVPNLTKNPTFNFDQVTATKFLVTKGSWWLVFFIIIIIIIILQHFLTPKAHFVSLFCIFTLEVVFFVKMKF